MSKIVNEGYKVTVLNGSFCVASKAYKSKTSAMKYYNACCDKYPDYHVDIMDDTKLRSSDLGWITMTTGSKRIKYRGGKQ